MKKQKAILIILSAMLIILELLPYGAVLKFAKGPEAGGGTVTEAYSYFDPLPFGNALFYPMIIAVLSCALMCLVLIYALKSKALGAIKVISIIIVILSFSPIALGASYFTAVGIAIAAVAFAEAVLSFVIGQKADKNAPVTPTAPELSN